MCCRRIPRVCLPRLRGRPVLVCRAGGFMAQVQLSDSAPLDCGDLFRNLAIRGVHTRTGDGSDLHAVCVLPRTPRNVASGPVGWPTHRGTASVFGCSWVLYGCPPVPAWSKILGILLAPTHLSCPPRGHSRYDRSQSSHRTVRPDRDVSSGHRFRGAGGAAEPGRLRGGFDVALPLHVLPPLYRLDTDRASWTHLWLPGLRPDLAWRRHHPKRTRLLRALSLIARLERPSGNLSHSAGDCSLGRVGISGIEGVRIAHVREIGRASCRERV